MAKLTAVKKEWFVIPGDEDKAKIQIKHLTPGDARRISGGTSRWVGRPDEINTEKFNTEFEYDPLEQIRRERIEAVTDWENFFDEHGQQMKCSEKNKSTWLDADPELGKSGKSGKSKKLSEWIDEFREKLAKDCPPEEELEKN